MLMKCSNCGGMINKESTFCFYCGKSTKEQRIELAKRKKHRIMRNIVILIGIGVLVFLLSRIPLLNARRTITKYVREVHPDSKIIEEHIKYQAIGYYFILGIRPDCYITFEENGFQYLVDYNHKDKSVIDYYNHEKLTNDVGVFLNEKFFKPRGIENVNVRCQFHFNSPIELPTEWSEYYDSYTVHLVIRDQGSTPREVGWIYDFYKFWNENMIFPPEWYLSFDIRNANESGCLYVSYETNCINAADLYKWFY